ncbi:MAG: AAA family ATPase [Thermodesulfobacteriota bacterium]
MLEKALNPAIIDNMIKGLGGKQSGTGAMCHCPCHDDKNPSLSIAVKSGKLLVKCQAGCPQNEVVASLKSRGLWPSDDHRSDTSRPQGVPGQWSDKSFTASWEYKNATGDVIGYVARYDDGKDKIVIPFFKKDGDRWKSGAAPQPRTLYNIDKLASNPGKPVVVVEGEKACDAASRLLGDDWTVITWPGGCKAVSKGDWTKINGRLVFIWPDADEPGREAAEAVKQAAIQAGAATVAVVTPPADAVKGWDLADAEVEGWDAKRINQYIADNARTYQPEPEKKELGGFSLIRLSEIETRRPDWLVKRFIEVDSLAQFYGDPESCKSLLSIDLAGCVSAGISFHGMPVKQGPVVYIAGEGWNGLRRRFTAWEIRHQVSLKDAPVFVSTGNAALSDAEFLKTVLDAINTVSEKDGTPVLIIVDTVARNFGPGDENSTKDMTAFISAVDMIREQTRAAILLIHHTGHGDKSRGRGSMALKGALDAEYRLEVDPFGTVRLYCSKIKEHERPDPMAFQIRTVDLGMVDEDSEPITSAVLDLVDFKPPSICKPKSGKWQKTAKAELDRLYDELSEGVDGVLFDAWKSACIQAGIPRNRFHEVKGQFHVKDNHVYQV